MQKLSSLFFAGFAMVAIFIILPISLSGQKNPSAKDQLPEIRIDVKWQWADYPPADRKTRFLFDRDGRLQMLYIDVSSGGHPTAYLHITSNDNRPGIPDNH